MLVSAKPISIEQTVPYDLTVIRVLTAPVREIEQGVFATWAFHAGDTWFPEFNEVESGVADSVEQIKRHHNIVNDSREFIILVTPIRRDEQPEQGGWRWHKWGAYIGTHKPRCEYLYDEQGIEQVFVYTILERRN